MPKCARVEYNMFLLEEREESRMYRRAVDVDVQMCDECTMIMIIRY